nr:hypothetical protein [Tanacetum cinerariifolium]
MHPKPKGIIALIDAAEDVTLEEVDAAKDAKVAKYTDVQGRLEERRKGVVIRDPEETATPSTIVKTKEKEDNAVLRYQAWKRKPQIEAHARNNMMVYLKNMAILKMDFFKGMRYDDIRPIFKKYFNSNVAFLEKSEKELEEEASITLKRKGKSSEEKAAKKQKLDEEMILLVERRYPLTRFTLDQILNNVRLEVKEESEVSLELLRFMRRQQQEGYRTYFGVDAVEDFKEYTLRDYYCWLKTYCCWYKLKLLDNAADSILRLLEQSVAAEDKMKK